MGKIRVKTIGDESAEKKQKAEAKKRKEAKRLEDIEQQKNLSQPADQEIDDQAVEVEAKTSGNEEPVANDSSHEEVKAAKPKLEVAKTPQPAPKKEANGDKSDKRSSRYQTVASLVDKSKTYTVKEALDMLPKLRLAKFDETIELHINTSETGVSGNFVLPHGTGKKRRVVIATDEVIADIEKGNITFDVLIAHPTTMVKLARVARTLGPRGLMPNPKNGTISPNPEEAAKKFEGGQVNFKTEPKNPIIHLSIGKSSFEAKQLLANYEVAIKAVGKSKIRSIILKSTMSPGIKVSA